MDLRIPGAIALVVVGAAAGFAGTRAYERSQATQRMEAFAQRAQSSETEVRRGAEQWADALAASEGEAVLRSFAAGLAAAMLSGRGGSLDVAGTSLLRLPGVQAVTVLRPDGTMLYASDAKLTVSGTGNEQTRWALTAKDFMSRGSQANGVQEMALPITDRGTVLAIVWLAFDSARVRDRERPEALNPAAAPGDAVAH